MKIINKILSIIFISMFLVSCIQDSPPKDPIEDEKNYLEIVVSSLPDVINYTYGESFNTTGLVVEVRLANNTYQEIHDYSVSQIDSNSLGEIDVLINWQTFSTSFKIYYHYPEKIELLELKDALCYSKNNLFDDSLIVKINKVQNGGRRTADTLVRFIETNLIKTNIYGYEVAVDQYGVVVDLNVNVDLPKGGMILSAHGSRIADLKNNILPGDILLWEDIDHSISVYRNNLITNVFSPYEYMQNSLEILHQTSNIIEYNQIAVIINSIIPIYNEYYQYIERGEYHLASSIKDQCLGYLEEFKIDEIIHMSKYSYVEEISDLNLLKPPISNNYQLIATYQGVIYGGWRAEDTIVYYNLDNFRTRNTFGYEYSIDSNGYVIASDTLVDLVDGGAILSGINEGANFLKDNLQLYDRIEYDPETKKLSIYRDHYYGAASNIFDSLKNVYEKIGAAYIFKKGLDYVYIEEIKQEITDEYNDLLYILSSYNLNNLSYHQKETFSKLIKSLESKITILEFQVIEHQAIAIKGYWHYSFREDNSLYHEKTKESVCNYLNLIKSMGFNTIYINPHSNGYVTYQSELFNQLPALSEYDYEEYGNDYLLCFITEAHKLGLEVVAFTQTFMYQANSINGRYENWYQMTFQGEISLGSVNYYDITNDEVQNVLIEWYKELVSKYDFDGIEYDIIRYPSCYLVNYDDFETIANPNAIIDHGYTTYSMNKFMEKYQLNGDLKQLIVSSSEVRKLWTKFKQDELNSFVERSSNEMRKINPNIKITAAVLVNYELASKYYLQDWVYWYQNGWIDAIEVMSYTSSNQSLEDNVHSNMSLSDMLYISFGISPLIKQGTVKMNAIQINSIQSIGGAGYVLFSNTTSFGKLDLVSGFQSIAKWSVNPWSDEKTIVEAYFSDLYSKIINYYQFVDLISDYQELLDLCKNVIDYDSYLANKDLIEREISNIMDETIYNKIFNDYNQLKKYCEYLLN